MGLDDFIEDDKGGKKDENELAMLNIQEPPDADSWRKQEPGIPEWLDIIRGETIDSDETDSDEKLKIDYSQYTPEDTHISSEEPEDLDDNL